VLTARHDALAQSGFDDAVERVPMTEAEFELFYRRNGRPLWAYLARVTGDPSLADDLVQKSFFQFLRVKLDTNEEARLRSLLFRIASNLVVDHWRDAARERKVVEATRRDAMTHDLDMRHDVAKAFSSLSPRERMLLWLAHVEGSTHREIGEALQLREKSVKVLLHRARKKMAEIMKREAGSEGTA